MSSTDEHRINDRATIQRLLESDSDVSGIIYISELKTQQELFKMYWLAKLIHLSDDDRAEFYDVYQRTWHRRPPKPKPKPEPKTQLTPDYDSYSDDVWGLPHRDLPDDDFDDDDDDFNGTDQYERRFDDVHEITGMLDVSSTYATKKHIYDTKLKSQRELFRLKELAELIHLSYADQVRLYDIYKSNWHTVRGLHTSEPEPEDELRVAGPSRRAGPVLG